MMSVIAIILFGGIFGGVSEIVSRLFFGNCNH